MSEIKISQQNTFCFRKLSRYWI